ncbi:hypothetical protein [Knoellia sp. Soil729]|uniref:hypothetical protein n=1 Tax=Knoellia sp. Soil729 TaxID=1736394 RepID=UPI0006FF45A6|nr:hypothetical protein [Knoellia sp. Soil729]KRE42162.1 hypothetical protein ASG74_06790 [Knoellia sp. Soil729]
MTAGRFVGLVVGLLLATALLVWVVVSLVAVAYALNQRDGDAARLYAVFAVVGIALAALAGWVGSRVASARIARQ